MKKVIRTIIQYAIFFGIGAGLVWWQISGMTQEEKKQFVLSLENAHYIYLVPVLIIGLLSHYLRALRWKLLIDPIKPVSASNSFYAVMIGYLGNTFIPRAGEILRCTMLNRYEKVPFSSLLGTVIAERGFDMVSFLLFTLLTVLIQIGAVGNFITEKLKTIFHSGEDKPSFWIHITFFIFIIWFLFWIINFIFKRFSERSWIKKAKGIWDELKGGLITIFHLKKKTEFILYTMLIWVCYTSQIYIGFKALDITANLGFPVAMSVLTLSTVAMIVAPGGLGAFPIALQQALLIYGIHNISFGWLVWGANTLIIIAAGLICLGLMIYQNRNKLKRAHPANEDLSKEI